MSQRRATNGCQTDRIRCQSTGKHLTVRNAQPVLQRLARYTLDTVHLGTLKATKCCIWRRSTVSAGWKALTPRPSHATGNHRHRQGIDLNRTEEEWRTLFKTCGDETNWAHLFRTCVVMPPVVLLLIGRERADYPLRCSAGLQRPG